jgi:hypothetical protein
VDREGNLLLSVDACTSTDMPASADAAQPANRGAADGFFVALPPALSAVIYATYLGGSAHDGSREAALAPDGSFVCAGDTASVDFPCLNAYDSTLGGSGDGFVARFIPLP